MHFRNPQDRNWHSLAHTHACTQTTASLRLAVVLYDDVPLLLCEGTTFKFDRMRSELMNVGERSDTAVVEEEVERKQGRLLSWRLFRGLRLGR